MDLGKVYPTYFEGEPIREWRIPVEVYLVPSAKKLVVKNIYFDEGVFCIDVEDEIGSND